jgi:hypothetical protein
MAKTSPGWIAGTSPSSKEPETCRSAIAEPTTVKSWPNSGLMPPTGHPGLAGPGIFVHSRMPDGSVILTAKPIADRGAEGERRNPGQDDLDAADVLDLDSWPGTDTSLGHLTVRNPARGHARERRGEADIRDQTPRPQEDTAARSAHPSPRITLSDKAAERERAHPRSALERSLRSDPLEVSRSVSSAALLNLRAKCAAVESAACPPSSCASSLRARTSPRL